MRAGQAARAMPAVRAVAVVGRAGRPARVVRPARVRPAGRIRIAQLPRVLEERVVIVRQAIRIGREMPADLVVGIRREIAPETPMAIMREIPPVIVVETRLAGTPSIAETLVAAPEMPRARPSSLLRAATSH